MKFSVTLFFLTWGLFSYSQAVVDYVDGEAWVNRSGERVELSIGDEALIGDTLFTGPRTTLILALNQGTLKLQSSTSLRLDNITEEVNLHLNAGGVFSKVRPGRTSPFQIRTSHMVAGVRGTEFFISFGRQIDEVPDVWLCVNTGTVEVGLLDQEKSVLVEAGKGINVLGGSKITDPQFFPWTLELNWNMDPKSGKVQDNTDLDGAYSDLLDQDYF